jgi:hypothetical protein
MLRSAIGACTRVFDALWRWAADPGPINSAVSVGPGAAEQRKERCTASGEPSVSRRESLVPGPAITLFSGRR